MHRRHFLNTAAAALALPAASQPTMPAREFYLLQTYHVRSGPQTALCQTYFTTALLPALARRGLGPVGTFRLDVGPETPVFHVLIPGASLEALATLDLSLSTDTAFLQAAEPFWHAPAAAPAFQRVESQLFSAFPGWPRLTPPDPHKPRIFQLRTYESPSHAAHVRKVEMFHRGEFDIFAHAGFGQVFYGDALTGPRLPNLTYLLTFPDMATLTASWTAFVADPAWKKLSTDPRYSSEEIVSNITNLILSPLPGSQI